MHVQGCLILSQVGLLFPVNHAPFKCKMKNEECRMEERKPPKPSAFFILHSAFFIQMASLTGFAPVISCMSGRHVGWTTPQGQNGEGGFAPPTRCM